ncbi:Small lysine-rich protein 1 [Fasciola gigantica]|uniref:Small lysine-rich protein 1 n=1 Tax=Fasciola gigantica TaxID=46835 RepID=A0A504YIU5_FASGI|nr:Small lysine-rich protein 1 [Fasciola gigantica]
MTGGDHMLNNVNPKKRGKSVKRKRTKSKRPKSTKTKEGKPPVDIMSPEAMENLYYIAHNAPSALVYCGYNWSGKKVAGGAKKGRRGKTKSNK